MCYHCATNPSIHHRCRHVATVSLPLSHHGVTFTVTSSQFRRCHCDVAFIVALLQCCCHSRVVAVPLLSHCRSFVVAVMVSPSSSHCRGFVIVAVLPSLLHCRGVVVTVSSSPLWCRLHRRIVAVSSSQSRRCGAFAVASLWFHHRHRHVTFIVTLSRCSLPFHHRCRGVAFVIALSRCCHCSFVVTVAVSLSLLHRRHLVVSSLHHGHGHHGCGCGHVVVVTVVVASLWLLLLRCGCCC